MNKSEIEWEWVIKKERNSEKEWERGEGYKEEIYEEI